MVRRTIADFSKDKKLAITGVFFGTRKDGVLSHTYNAVSQRTAGVTSSA